MSLDNIVQVNITKETSVPTRVGFGFGNFVSEDARFQSRLTNYGSYSEIQNDPYAGADTLAYGLSYFSQEIRNTRLYVTKKGQDLGRVLLFDIDSDLITANEVDVTISGQAMATVTFATDHDTTWALVAAGLTALSNVSTATVLSNRVIEITGLTPGAAIAVDSAAITAGASQGTLSNSIAAYEDTVLSYVDSLLAAESIDNDWYEIAIASRSESDVLAVAAYTETRVKIFSTTSNDEDIIDAGDSTDIGSQLKALGYDRSCVLYSSSPATFPEGGWSGGQLPKTPGSITWAYKEIKGTATDNLDSAALLAAHNKNVNTYTTTSGKNITRKGTMASGEYRDVMRGIDWIQVRMQEAVFTLLTNEDKVPFTDLGIGSIENAMRAVLETAETNLILAADPKFQIVAPTAASISTADKANRILRDLKFTGTLAGAIHNVIIDGTVSI